MTEHKIDLEHDRSSNNGNLHTATPVCSCGWRGFPVAAYNDDQYFVLGQQEKRHKREVGRATVS